MAASAGFRSMNPSSAAAKPGTESPARKPSDRSNSGPTEPLSCAGTSLQWDGVGAVTLTCTSPPGASAGLGGLPHKMNKPERGASRYRAPSPGWLAGAAIRSSDRNGRPSRAEISPNSFEAPLKHGAHHTRALPEHPANRRPDSTGNVEEATIWKDVRWRRIDTRWGEFRWRGERCC